MFLFLQKQIPTSKNTTWEFQEDSWNWKPNVLFFHVGVDDTEILCTSKPVGSTRCNQERKQSSSFVRHLFKHNSNYHTNTIYTVFLASSVCLPKLFENGDWRNHCLKSLQKKKNNVLSLQTILGFSWISKYSAKTMTIAYLWRLWMNFWTVAIQMKALRLWCCLLCCTRWL